MKQKLDLKRFIPIVGIITATLLIVSLNLDRVQSVVSEFYDVCAGQFGWLFILSNLTAFIFSVYIICGKYRNIKLGGEDAKPEYSTLSWIAMMFTTSCSAGLLVFGFIEPVLYSSVDVPWYVTPGTLQAYENSQMYTFYHWGLNAWSLYVPASIAIGYALYNKCKKSSTMSVACESVLGKHTNGFLGHIIDIFSTFGAVVAPVTSMGLGMPLLVLLITELFGLQGTDVRILQAIILIVWVAIFGTSIYRGLQKGIKNLSNINVILFFIFITFVGLFLVGIPTVLKTAIGSLGLYIQNFPRLITYIDPYGDGGFVKSWTIWYWAWLIVYMPLMGIFNARISKGRTLKSIALGQMIFCSLGCWITMCTLGNYGLKLQMSGQVDLAKVLSEQGQPQAILEIVRTMPCNKLMLVIVIALCFIFMATTVDSSSFVAAESTTIHDDNETTAPRWIRVVWAIIACVITYVLLQVGGFSAVQVLALLVGLPLAVIMFLVIWSTIKELRGGN